MFYCSIFYYFCSMNNVLAQIGNTPVNSSILESMYPNLSGTNQKVRWLERNGEIIRLKRGLYVGNPARTHKPLSTELIANHIYAPSYVSMMSALRYYGLIPEMVFTTQSMTLKHSRDFDTPIGKFEYKHIAREAFHIGITQITGNGYAFLIATPEKAICDIVANSTNVNLRYMKDAERYLAEDIRFDMDEFSHLDAEIFKACASVGKKAESIRTIIKLLQK